MHVLLVDDEDLVRAGTAEMLRALGHTVTEATGALDALRRLEAGAAIEVVVTDYMMPHMDGAELAHRIAERHPGMPVLVITGYAGGALDAGLPVLAKPFRQADLAQALQDLIQPAPDAANQPLVHSG